MANDFENIALHYSNKCDKLEERIKELEAENKVLNQYKEYVESRINECKIPNIWLPLYFDEWHKCVNDLAKELEQALKGK